MALFTWMSIAAAVVSIYAAALAITHTKASNQLTMKIESLKGQHSVMENINVTGPKEDVLAAVSYLFDMAEQYNRINGD